MNDAGASDPPLIKEESEAENERTWTIELNKGKISVKIELK